MDLSQNGLIVNCILLLYVLLLNWEKKILTLIDKNKFKFNKFYFLQKNHPGADARWYINILLFNLMKVTVIEFCLTYLHYMTE